MTTLIQQKSGNDCVLAAIAMAAGFERWEDVWTPEDLERVIKSGGIREEGPWLERAGFKKEQYRHMHVWGDPKAAQQLLWGRRALIACASLNNHGGSHMVFWDGQRIWDPHEGHWDQGWQFFKHITSLLISEVILFDDNVARDASTAAVQQAPAGEAQPA